MSNTNDTFIPALLAAKSTGLSMSSSARIGLIGSMAGGGQLPLTLALSTIFAKRAKPAVRRISRDDDVMPTNPGKDEKEVDSALAQKISRELSVIKKSVGQMRSEVGDLSERISKLEDADAPATKATARAAAAKKS